MEFWRRADRGSKRYDATVAALKDRTATLSPTIIAVMGLASILTSGTGAAAGRPDWAFLTPANSPPQIVAPEADDGSPKTVTGSTKSYTLTQIRDVLKPPEWFPQEHPPMPDVVAQAQFPDGKDARPLPPCAFCHLENGAGHVGSAMLAGLPAAYIVRQMATIRSGERRVEIGDESTGKLVTLIKSRYSDEQVRIAADYFASLKPQLKIRVVESASAPRIILNPKTLMQTAVESGMTEHLGDRIVEVPENSTALLYRDPHTKYVSYAPEGSVARGAALAATGSQGAVACASCHGPKLVGHDDSPPIAGRFASYTARQLWNFQSGARRGPAAAPMNAVVANLRDDDLLAIAAYIATLAPD